MKRGPKPKGEKLSRPLVRKHLKKCGNIKELKEAEAIIKYRQTGCYADVGEILEQIHQEKFMSREEAPTQSVKLKIIKKQSMRGKRWIDKLRASGDLVKMMAYVGLDDDYYVLKLLEFGQAKKLVPISQKSDVHSVADYETQVKAIQVGLKLRGHLKDDVVLHTEYSKEEVEKGIEAIAEKVRARRLMVGNVGNKRAENV
jgi:hypothetical protein